MQEIKRSISIEEVKKRLDKNFQEDQYYVSGKLDPDIFADSCVFTDPTVVSRGALRATVLPSDLSVAQTSCVFGCAAPRCVLKLAVQAA